MSRLPLFCVVFALAACVMPALAAPPAKKDPVKRNADKLDGVWVLEAVEQIGVKLEGDRIPVRLRGMTRLIKGKAMTVTAGGRDYACSFTVDATKTPTQMDITVTRNGREQKLKGIYQIKGDTLQIAEDLRTRPTSFQTDKDTRAVVYTFKRQKG